MSKIKKIMLLQVSVLLYSVSSIVSKYASNESFLSFKYIIFILLLLLILALYSIIWQQVLKHTTLSFAYINKATSIIWGLIFGYLLFFEDINTHNILGVLIVIIGIILVSKGESNNE